MNLNGKLKFFLWGWIVFVLVLAVIEIARCDPRREQISVTVKDAVYDRDPDIAYLELRGSKGAIVVSGDRDLEFVKFLEKARDARFRVLLTAEQTTEPLTVER